MSEEIILGDIVAVNVQAYSRREGLVVGSHIDLLGRRIIEIQFDPDDIYHAWHPTVTRVRRTTYYLPPARRSVTIDRKVYW